MSNSNGINTLARSINGIITYSDGSGTLIQNGKIITITLTANIITAINLIISNIGCNGILTIGSATTTEININSSTKIELVSPLINLNATVVKVNYILPLTLNGIIRLGDITQGSSQIDYCVYIQGKRNALSYYQAASGQTYPTFVESVSNGIVAGFDFHCSGANTVDYDARIECNNATTGTAIGTATMDILANIINLNALSSTNITAPTTNITSTTSIVLTSPNTRISKQGTNGFFMVTDGTGLTNTYMDFYSSGFNIYSSRIISYGGTSTPFYGTLGIQSGLINIQSNNGNINLTASAEITLSPTTLTTINKQVSLGWIQTSTTPCYTNINTVNGQCNIDFHSSGLFNVGYDSRIYAYGGTATSGNGAMAFTGTQFAFLGDVLTSAIKARTPGGTLTIGDNLISGSMTIGSALTTGNLNIINGGNLNISSATTNITGNINIGNVNIAYSGGATPSYFEIVAYSALALIDIHSSGTTNVDYDARILCNGAATTGTTSGTGNLSYLANSHNFSGGVKFNNGFSFNQGNLTSNSFIQTGTANPNLAIGAGNAITFTVGFTSAFSSNPSVFISLYTNNSASMGIVLGAAAITTGFTLSAYNSRNVTAPAGTWGYQFIAVGPM